MMNSLVINQPSQPLRWWLPSISVVLWLAFFLAANLSAARVMMVASDSDACWHWQQGNWMLKHQAVVRTELFSHTNGGARVVDLWWLSEIVTALAGNLLGWGGIVLVASVVCATLLWLLYRQLLAEGNELLLSTALTLLAAAVCVTHWVARPHLATQFLVVVFAWQLRWFKKGRVTACQLLVLLPLLTALWANLHGAFIFAFVLIGIYWTGTIVDWARAITSQRPPLKSQGMVLTTLGVACFLASFLNPNGWKLDAQVLHYVKSPLMMGFAQEYLPPNFHDPSTLPFLAVMAVVLLTLLIVRPRLNTTDILLLAGWLFLSLRMVRNAPLFAIVAAPILAEHWNTYLLAARPSPVLRRYRSISAQLTAANQMAGARGLPILAVIAMIMILAKPQVFGGQPLISTVLPADRFPVAAVEFLRQSPDAVHGVMFNEYTWGGYFTMAMPERKVFIHPNLDAYTEEIIRDFLQVNNAQPGWEDVLKKYHVDWTILPHGHQLNPALARHLDWRLVYDDPVATVYERIP